jgi:hypothetical protein
MRWIFVIILAYVVLLLQTTVVGLITLNTETLGAIGPDLAAVAAVFLALHGRSVADVMIAAWVLGIALDLNVSGGFANSTVVGPMALGYCLGTAAVFHIRELLFRDWFVTQIVLTFLFCIVAHGTWILWQALSVQESLSWSLLGELALQGLLLSFYTALLAPVGHFVMRPLRGILIPSHPSRGRRASG